MSISAHEREIADAFRGAMRCFAASVSIVAVRNGEKRSGATVTAVCGVSISPPSILVCINRAASAWEVLRQTEAFSLNVLGEEDAMIAEVFAGRTDVGRGEARFAYTKSRWRDHALGPPVLDCSVASIICQTGSRLESGSHSVIIGAVRDVVRGGRYEAPLVYAHGSYHCLALRPTG